MIYRSAAVIERPREIGLSEGDLRVWGDGALGLRESGRAEVVILFVNPGPIININSASLEDTVKIKEENTHTQVKSPS